MKEKERKQIEDFCEGFAWTPDKYYWKHTLQVRKYGLLIQEQVGGDRDVVELSTLFHDVGKAKLLAEGHEELSAQIAEEFLSSLAFNKKKMETIGEVIKYKNSDLLEERILRAADSMSLLADNSGGREWYFNNVLKGDREKILDEIEKSWLEIDFDFARGLIKKNFEQIRKEYTS